MAPTKVEQINHICFVILAAAAVTAGLIYTRSVMVLFVFSFFLYTVLSTGIGLISTFVNVRRWISISLMMLIIFLMTFLLVAMMSNSIEEFVRGAKQYQDKILEFGSWVESLAAKYGFNMKGSVTNQLSELPIFSYVQGLTTGIIGFFGKTFLVFIMTLFLILGNKKSDINNTLLDEIHSKISKYITIKTILSLATGVLAFFVMSLFQVELAFMFGVLTFLLNFIPSIGSVIATLLPMPVVFLQYDASGKTLLILILLSVIQLVIGNVLEPKLLGERLDLHPVTVLVFLLFWGLVWGVPGMFLAVPLTAILKIVLSQIDSTQGIAQLLAGRIPNSHV